MRKFITKRIVKPFLEKNGIKICEMCDEALAKSPMGLCLECQEEFENDMRLEYLRNRLEASR